MAEAAKPAEEKAPSTAAADFTKYKVRQRFPARGAIEASN